MKKNKYEVLLVRDSYANKMVEVEAYNTKEARRIALENAGSHIYEVKDSIYDIEHVELTEDVADNWLHKDDGEFSHKSGISWEWWTDELNGDFSSKLSAILDTHAVEYIASMIEKGFKEGELYYELESYSNDSCVNVECFSGYWILTVKV